MTLILQGPRARIASVPFLFRAADCVDDQGLFALSYGRKVYANFSRSSIKRVRDGRGFLQAVPSGAVPISVSNARRTVLIEQLRQNILPDSDAADAVGWVKVGVTVSANSTPGPETGTVADVLVESFNNEEHYVQRSFPSTLGSVYAGSAFVRALSRTKLRLLLFQSGAPFTVFGQAILDATTGQLSNAIGQEFGVELWAPGWWRVYASGAALSDTSVLRVSSLSASGTATYLGDGSQAFAVASLQAELGNLPSSPIRTGATALTRAADGLFFEVPALNPIRSLTAYVRSINLAAFLVDSGNRHLLQIGSSNPASGARFNAGGHAGVNGIRAQFDDGFATQSRAASFTNPSVRGDLVELLSYITSTGGLGLAATVNMGAEQVVPTAGSLLLGGSWAAARVYLTGILTTGNTIADYTHVAISDGQRVRDDLRELAGV